MDEVSVMRLKRMKCQMAKRGNWKEVERINKMIKFQEDLKSGTSTVSTS